NKGRGGGGVGKKRGGGGNRGGGGGGGGVEQGPVGGEELLASSRRHRRRSRRLQRKDNAATAPAAAGHRKRIGARLAGTALALPSGREVALQPAAHAFTYIVAPGDCNTGNPGHCIADPHQFFVAQQLLGFNWTDTAVVLRSGFGANKYAKGGASGGAGSNGGSKGDNGATKLPFHQDWEVLADAVVWAMPGDKND
ncbi:unnamed protein product, partial [Phaeothamnion confervicola]